jgi:hypothetical protein
MLMMMSYYYLSPGGCTMTHFTLLILFLQKWHECLITFNAPMLTITEFEDEKVEVSKYKTIL